MNRRISVIIPALNEEKTIEKVVRIAKCSPYVDEVIVVDDKSVDDTVKNAEKAGARVITGTMLGKGSSMQDGLREARNEIIVYLDADVRTYTEDVVVLLTDPICKERADFAKSTFSRKAGRVTEIVAKPLLEILFPALLKFSQPLSGMIAGKKSYLEKAVFENDYGVDIGLLIDMYNMGARIEEVNIGNIEHKMKTWHQLPKMSKDVSRAILKRANMHTEGIHTGMDKAYLGNLEREYESSNSRMVIFDMDNTILKGRFIYKAAETFGFLEEMFDILSSGDEPYVTTKLIAKNLKGMSVMQIRSIADSIPLVDDIRMVIDELRTRGYITGIISDSYSVVTEHIREKIGADFSVANELEIEMGVATGEVRVPSIFLRNYHSICSHSVCKTNAMLNLAAEFGVPLQNCVAIGDGKPDICMIKNAGMGIAFCSSVDGLKKAADRSIEVKKFGSLLELLDEVNIAS